MQLFLVNLDQNMVRGMLPESWGNLTRVSHCVQMFVSLIHVAAPASLCKALDPAKLLCPYAEFLR